MWWRLETESHKTFSASPANSQRSGCWSVSSASKRWSFSVEYSCAMKISSTLIISRNTPKVRNSIWYESKFKDLAIGFAWCRMKLPSSTKNSRPALSIGSWTSLFLGPSKRRDQLWLMGKRRRTIRWMGLPSSQKDSSRRSATSLQTATLSRHSPCTCSFGLHADTAN